MFPPTSFFGIVRQKFSDGKSSYSLPPIHKSFPVPEIAWKIAHKCLSAKCFGTVRQDTPHRKTCSSPPPLIHKLFRCRNFSEKLHTKVPLQSFLTLWDKLLSKENLQIPSISIYFFTTGTFLKHCTEGLLYEKFGTFLDKKNPTENLDNPSPLIRKFFHYWKFSETLHRRVPLRKFSGLRDKELPTENLDPRLKPSHPKTFSLTEFFKNTAQKGTSTKLFGNLRQNFPCGNS